LKNLEVAGVSTLFAHSATELHLIQVLELFDLPVITDFLLGRIEMGLEQLRRQQILDALLGNVVIVVLGY
jgi:hypothetical protein